VAERIDWPRWATAAALATASVPLGLLAGLNPEISVAVAFAVAFALVVFSDLALGLSFFVVLGFLAFLPYGMYDVLARIVLALAWFALLMTRKRSELEFPVAHPIAAVILLLFFGWVCVSLVWAESASEVFQAIERYGLSALLLLIVFTAVRSERDLGRVATAFIVGATAAALYGVFAGAPSEDTEGRLGTALLDPNILAASLVSAIGLAVTVIALNRSPSARLGMVAALAFSAIALWLTASRGGLFALGIALLAAVLLAGRWRLQIAAVAVVIASVSYIYFAGVAPDDVRNRVTGPVQGQERIIEGRTSLWQVGWRAVEANPVIGVGASNFRVASRHYLLEPGAVQRTDQILDEPQVAHNAYLEMLAELGIVGLLLFGGVIFLCLGCSIRAVRLYMAAGNDRMQLAALGIAVAQVGSLAANFFISDQYSIQLWVLLGLGPVVLSLAREGTGESPPSTRRRRVASFRSGHRAEPAPARAYSSS
jgi:O-antigen ligase